MSELDPNFPGDLAWIDVETTGLDPDKCALLEISARHTRGDRLLEGYHAVIAHPDPSRLHWEPRAEAIHRRSGLLGEVCDGMGEGPAAVRDGLLEFFTRAHDASGGERLWVAGCNVGFDRAFLRRFCPEVMDFLHYRNFDLNALIRWHGIEKPQGFDRPHRSEGDLDQDWELFKQLLEAREAQLCP